MVESDADSNSRVKPEWGFTSNSLSGRERNRMFLRHGDNFSDVTLVSGTDDLADGRSFVIFDFDQDGWQDIAVMSLNAPRFKIYRNEMKAYYPDNTSFRFRLVGGNQSPKPNPSLSNRDAIGTQVLVTFESGKKIMMHKQAGEGFASQNSETQMIGIPPGDSVVRLDVRWPSGLKKRIDNPDASEILTIKETLE